MKNIGKLLCAMILLSMQLACATNDSTARAALFDLIQKSTSPDEQADILKDVPIEYSKQHPTTEIFIPSAREWEVELLKCEQAFPFVVSGPEQHGTIWVAKCSTQIALARSLPDRASITVSRLVSGAQGAKAPEFLTPTNRSVNHATLHYFPVVLVGHGPIIFPTAMLISETEVFVVQFQLENCNEPDRFAICRNSSALAQNIVTKAKGAFQK